MPALFRHALMAAALALPAASFVAPFAAQPAAAQSLMALHDAARQHDAALQAAQAQLQAARARAGQARAGLLPQAGLSGNVTRSHLDVHLGAIDNARSLTQRNLNLNASQPLYRPANRITATQGERQVALAEMQWQAAAQELITRLAQAYFDVLAAHDSLELARAFKAAVGQQLESARQNFEVGNATITDSREAQARFDLARAQEIAAENEWRVARLALEQVTGLPAPAPRPLAQPVQLPEGLLKTPLTGAESHESAEAWAQLAQERSPAIAQARLALEVAELETRKAKTGHLPTVDLQAAYGWQQYPNGNPSVSTMPYAPYRHRAASVGVAVNVPLFAGFAVQERVRETLSLQDKARAELEGARRNVTQAVRSAFYGLQSGLAQVAALQAAEKSSLTALQASQTGLEAGVRISLDVLNAQTQLYQTRRDLARARYAVLTGALRLRQASGTLQEEDLLPINALLEPQQKEEPEEPAAPGQP